MMIHETYQVQVVLDDNGLALDELCRLAGVTQVWVRERMEPPDALRFTAADLRRVIRIACLERDFDAVPELACLVADLEQEVAVLRTKLRRLGG